MNTSLHWSHQRGLSSEEAAVAYFARQGSRLYAKRERTPYGEADVLMLALDGALQIIEVKSIGTHDFVSHRVTTRQKQRLRNIALFFEAQYEHVELWLALVDSRNKVQVFDEF